MTAKCDQRNPLLRSGTNQLERYADALDPDSAPIDGRSLSDILVFAQRFGRHLAFYDADNSVQGNWIPFFRKDESAVLAALEQLPYDAISRFSRSLRDWLTADPGRSDAHLGSHFRLLFHLPLLLLQEVGEQLACLPVGHPLRAFAVKAVERDTSVALRDLVAYARGVRPPANDIELFVDTPLSSSDYNTTFDDGDDRIQLPTAVTRRIAVSSALADLPISSDLIAGIEPLGWSTLFGSVAADARPYSDHAGSVFDDVRDALSYGSFTKAFETLFQTVERLAVEAGAYLDSSLEDSDEHTPHYGLWLAFLKLLEKNREHLNTLTSRHLAFYYEQVLQLAPRAAEPDQVHLLFELNRNVDDHLLAAATRFKAGKDDAGAAVAYTLDPDLVINRGQVVELRSLYLPEVDLDGATGLRPLASSVADSRDGVGAELSDESPGWRPFGPDSAPVARVGFAIADRQLFLREGARTIDIAAAIESTSPLFALSASYPGVLRVLLTAEDGWLEISDADNPVVKIEDGSLTVQVTLDGEAPPIVPHDPKLHGEEFTVDTPMARVEFAFDSTSTDPAGAAGVYAALRDLRFESITVSVTVDDARNFSLQNDLGVIDTSRSFLPFGPTPEAGSSLILGSSEVFSKPLSSITLWVVWAEGLTALSNYFLKSYSSETRVRQLVNGKWDDLGTTAAGEFFQVQIQLDTGSPVPVDISIPDAGSISASAEQTIDNPPYSTTSRSGFVRFDLEQGFGHDRYTRELTLALVALANDPKSTYSSTVYNSAGSVPAEPYTPRINEIHLDYTTSPATPATLLHLHPFGHCDAVAPGRLLPELAADGELYIGISDLAPPQRLTLLFQTVDGSANPLKSEGTVQWHSLQGDAWVAFETQEVDDKTGNLTGSGVVGLAVPEAADSTHHLLPSGLHWIRLSVAQDADALNDLLSIDTQAASATFVDQDNDPDFVATPLPAGTISKLEVSDAAVKKIVQPYESFGGRAAESDDAFRVRVSERLRHKDRAATMWDYERLVLEQFPGVYRVKCVNHTALCRDTAGGIIADNELKPGHVLLVPVPYVSPDGVIDPLRPYTDRKTLGDIDTYLRRRTSPFVRLEVQNPRIEEVQVRFEVAFTSAIADISFYERELNDAIVRHLTPWSYDEGAEISFGGKWYKSTIIDFVEEQSYVDYVKHFEMFHKPDITQSDTAWELARIDVEEIRATTARSILVSHATHTITNVS